MTVTALNIPPKKITEKYREELIEVTFDPKYGHWRWEFTMPSQPIHVAGAGCKTPDAAIKAAKKQVDKMHGRCV